MLEKYSVLMSLYIKEKPEYLRSAIQSMVDQTYAPDEIVIVKDGIITEELESVLNCFSEKYPNLFNIVGCEKRRDYPGRVRYVALPVPQHGADCWLAQSYEL